MYKISSPQKIHRYVAVFFFSLAFLLSAAWISADRLFLHATAKDKTQAEDTHPKILHADPNCDYATVPRLDGMDVRDAVIALKKAKLAAKISECELPYDAKGGTVMYTRPKSDERLALGDVVTLFVKKSEAAASVRCPDLLGMCRIDAVSALRAHGLEVGKTEGDSTLFSSTVCSQSRLAGTFIPKGSRVDIVLEPIQVQPIEDNEFINNRLNFKQDIEKYDNFLRERSFRWHITRQEE